MDSTGALARLTLLNYNAKNNYNMQKIAPVLTIVFQASLDQGHLPNIWRTAAVVPIYKKGSKTEPSNYRPVSLTCICSKILEHIVYSAISKHLEHLVSRSQTFSFFCVGAGKKRVW